MNTDDIALIVDEPVAGHFYWILQQRDFGDGNPKTIDATPGPMPTYGSALMAGIAALQRCTQAAGRGFDVPIVHAYRAGRGSQAATGPTTIH